MVLPAGSSVWTKTAGVLRRSAVDRLVGRRPRPAGECAEDWHSNAVATMASTAESAKFVHRCVPFSMTALVSTSVTPGDAARYEKSSDCRHEPGAALRQELDGYARPVCRRGGVAGGASTGRCGRLLRPRRATPSSTARNRAVGRRLDASLPRRSCKRPGWRLSAVSSGFEGRSSLQTWIYRICLNRARTAMGKEYRTALV